MPPPPTPACRGHSGSDSGSVAQDVTRPGQAHASPIAPRPDGPCVKPRPSSHPRRLFVQGYEHDPRVIHAQPIHERGIHGKKRRPPALIGTVPITALAEAGRIIHGNHPHVRAYGLHAVVERNPRQSEAFNGFTKNRPSDQRTCSVAYRPATTIIKETAMQPIRHKAVKPGRQTRSRNVLPPSAEHKGNRKTGWKHGD